MTGFNFFIGGGKEKSWSRYTKTRFGVGKMKNLLCVNFYFHDKGKVISGEKRRWEVERGVHVKWSSWEREISIVKKGVELLHKTVPIRSFSPGSFKCLGSSTWRW